MAATQREPGVIPPRPGKCPIPDPYKPYPNWSVEELLAYEEWISTDNVYWEYIAEQFAMRFPSRLGMCFEQPGHVIYADYEDKSWAWLGNTDDEHGDGPWAHGEPCWVGGYRYEADSDGERFTDRHLVHIEDPDDIESVVDGLVKVARELGQMPFTQSV